MQEIKQFLKCIYVKYHEKYSEENKDGQNKNKLWCLPSKSSPSSKKPLKYLLSLSDISVV